MSTIGTASDNANLITLFSVVGTNVILSVSTKRLRNEKQWCAMRPLNDDDDDDDDDVDDNKDKDTDSRQHNLLI